LQGLFEEYLAVEEQFATGGRVTEQEVIDSLRQVGNFCKECTIKIA
jgi:hypothetical protein